MHTKWVPNSDFILIEFCVVNYTVLVGSHIKIHFVLIGSREKNISLSILIILRLSVTLQLK